MAGTVIAAAPTKHRQRGVVRISVALATTATADGGDIPAAVIGAAFGRLVGVFYDGGCDASAVITLSDTKSGAPIVTFTTGTEGTAVAFRPTQVIVTNDGSAVTAAVDATNVNRDIVVGGKLSLTVANMGQSETGNIAFVFDEKGLGLGSNVGNTV